MGTRIPRGPPPGTQPPVTPPKPPHLPPPCSEEAWNLNWLQQALSAASESDNVRPEDVSKHMSPYQVWSGRASIN